MDITCEELVTSRDFKSARKNGQSSKTITRTYLIKGTDDPAVAQDYGPQDGTDYPDGRVESVVVDRAMKVLVVGGPDDGVIELTVNYGPAESAPPPQDEPEYELDLMAETVHIESAITQDHYPAEKDEVQNAIGVSADKIEGVDIYVPKAAYTEKRYLTSLSKQYVNIILDTVGKVNNKVFSNCDAGTVLFLGARARRKGQGKWEVEFVFSISFETDENIDTSSGAQAFTKGGWQYMWLKKGRVKQDDDVVNIVESVHVATVYKNADFGLLGLRGFAQ